MTNKVCFETSALVSQSESVLFRYLEETLFSHLLWWGVGGGCPCHQENVEQYSPQNKNK